MKSFNIVRAGWRYRTPVGIGECAACDASLPSSFQNESNTSVASTSLVSQEQLKPSCRSQRDGQTRAHRGRNSNRSDAHGRHSGPAVSTKTGNLSHTAQVALAWAEVCSNTARTVGLQCRREFDAHNQNEADTVPLDTDQFIQANLLIASH